MTEEKLTLKRLERLLEAYGGNPRRWPADERAAGEALLESSARAREMQAEALKADAWLDAAPSPARASGQLKAAILAACRGSTSTTRTTRWKAVWTELLAEIGGWRPTGAALAASLMLGIIVGGSVNLSDTTQGVDVLELAFLENNITEY